MDSPNSDYTSPEAYRSIRLPVELATTLNPETYRSEAFFKLEQEQVFAHSWVCVGYTSQVKDPGQIMPVTVGGQPVIICRDKQNKLQAYYNVCRHRGSLLVTAPTKAEKIRCPYHSWTYGLDGGELHHCPLFLGEKTAAAGEAEGSTQKAQATSEAKVFDKADYKLFPVRVESWGCFIFVNLDPKAMPLTEFLGDFTARYGNFPLDELVLVRRKKYDIAANWKLIAENFLEYYHLPWVHPELCTVTAIDMHQRNQGPGMYMSFYAHPLLRGGTPLDADFLPPMPRLTAEEADAGYFPLVFPNVAMFLMPHHLFSLLMTPTSPGHTEEYGDILVHPSLFDEPDFEKKLDEIFAFYDMVNIQDIVAVERVQKGVQVKAYQGGRMSFRFEEPLHRFQNILANYMIGNPRILPGDE